MPIPRDYRLQWLNPYSAPGPVGAAICGALAVAASMPLRRLAAAMCTKASAQTLTLVLTPSLTSILALTLTMTLTFTITSLALFLLCSGCSVPGAGEIQQYLHPGL